MSVLEGSFNDSAGGMGILHHNKGGVTPVFARCAPNLTPSPVTAPTTTAVAAYDFSSTPGIGK